MALEKDFPYHSSSGYLPPCTPYPKNVTCDGFIKLASNSAEALETALATTGPVAVVVAANWVTYGGGVFSGGCPDRYGGCTLDHVVVVVGYTHDAWVVRNSWGASFGEQG